MSNFINHIRYGYRVSDLVSEDKRVEECSICLETYGENIEPGCCSWMGRICLQISGIKKESLAVTKCEHVFHKACLKTWLQESTTCPLCREVLKEESKPLNIYFGPIDMSIEVVFQQFFGR
ncbi:MAG: RING finger domain-containing protein [Chlamydiota bacterium]